MHFVEETGVYLVTRYRYIIQVVRDPETFCSKMPTGPHAVIEARPAARRAVRGVRGDPGPPGRQPHGGRVPVLLGADPPAHTRQRNLVNRAFSPPRVRQIEDSIRDIADSLVDAFADRGSVELVSSSPCRCR